MSSDLNVGRIGEGSLSIALGGDVTSARSLIGNNAGSEGTATVSGDGSTWATSGDLYIGNEGTGTLVVADGGYVSADEITIANEAGSTGTFIIGAALGETAGGTGTVDADAIHFGEGDGALVFNFGGDDLTFDALIDGDGEITVANGTVIYQGDASGFTGTTEITGGTMELDEATLGGTISVSGWGTLSGTGTLGSTTIESGATVTPGGDDVGTLTIDGDSSSRRPQPTRSTSTPPPVPAISYMPPEPRPSMVAPSCMWDRPAVMRPISPMSSCRLMVA